MVRILHTSDWHFGKTLEKAVADLLQKVIKENNHIIFNGNNYAPEWVEEAERRGLLNLKSLPDAMEHFLDKKNIDLFVKNKICSARNGLVASGARSTISSSVSPASDFATGSAPALRRI